METTEPERWQTPSILRNYRTFPQTRVKSSRSVTLALSGEMMSKGRSDGFQVHFTLPSQLSFAA